MNWYLTIGVVYFLIWALKDFRTKEGRDIVIIGIKHLSGQNLIGFILGICMSFVILVILWPVHLVFWPLSLWYLSRESKNGPEFYIKPEDLDKLK